MAGIRFPNTSTWTSNKTVDGVIANPTGTSDGTLTSISINGLKYAINGGSGGGGTSDYSDLNNKPQINGTTLVSGNNTLATLGIQPTITSSNKLSTSLITGLATVATSGSYTDLSSKPTIPATNVIPSESTANKILLSTNSGGTAAWSSSTVGAAAYKGTTSSVTQNSTDLITSGAVYDAIVNVLNTAL